jgi:surface polysaccharide O-acyltransferase-like enzyme
MMITGSLLIDTRKTDSLKAFFTKRMARLFILTIFWSLIYLIYQFTTGSMTWSSAIWSIAYGCPYFHLWYLYVALGLYAVIIPLRALCINSDRQTLLITLIITFALQTAYFLNESRICMRGIIQGPVLCIFQFIPYIPYIILGYYLKSIKSESNHVRTLAYSAVMVICALSVGRWLLAMRVGVSVAESIAYNNFNPLVGISSMLMYLIIKTYCFSTHTYIIYIKKACNVLAQFTLGIYVVHPLFIECIKKMLAPSILPGFIFGELCLKIFFVLSLSLSFTYIFSRIPYLKRLVM